MILIENNEKLLDAEKKRTRVSDVISIDDIKSWTPDVPVIILSGTDTGKSYFVKNQMYDVAKEENAKILMLIHRINCVRQFQMELERQSKQEVIDVDTYQKTWDKDALLICVLGLWPGKSQSSGLAP